MKRNARKELQKESDLQGEPILKMEEGGLALKSGDLELRGDFRKLLPRVKQGELGKEFLVKASKIKGVEGTLTAIDATAGMGEDSFILAAAGFRVQMYELDPVIAALLRDALRRAKEDPQLCEVAERMELFEEDSIEAMKALSDSPDLILLDPMFPERQKSALVKKKFQLLQKLERPCADEEKLLEAALLAKPRKILIKRPLKGPYLAGRKPDYSLNGKAIRYDCIVLARD